MTSREKILKFTSLIMHWNCFFLRLFYFWFKVDLRYHGMRATDLNFRVNVAAILLADVSKSNLNYEYFNFKYYLFVSY